MYDHTLRIPCSAIREVHELQLLNSQGNPDNQTSSHESSIL